MAIDKVLSKPIEAGLVPGVVAVAADDSGVIYEGAFGRRAVDSTEPMTLDSVFRIASMTKAITGTAPMQLVEKGRIGLEQPMGDVLPLVRDVKVLEGFDGDGTPRLRDPKTPVTLRHLLTHTAGCGYDIFNPDLARYVQIAGLPSILSRKNDALRISRPQGDGYGSAHLQSARHARHRARRPANSHNPLSSYCRPSRINRSWQFRTRAYSKA